MVSQRIMKEKNIMFHFVREGNLACLKELLKHREKDEVVKLVGYTSHGTTPLVIACRNGHYDVAEYLIEKCGANVNQTGSVIFGGEKIECAPPLWCAAAAGYLDLVKLLVNNGAKVNATTKTHSRPLRAACFDGHFDIVRYLVAHGADIEVTNREGHTCLMIACYRGHLQIVKFLLSLGANVNRKSIKGITALHDCAESGHLDVVKTLIKHGARMDVDSYGISPLLTAAVTGHKHIVEYFNSVPNLVTRKERIDALELLGATYVDKKRDMMGALECWRQAMEERYQKEPVMPKQRTSTIVAAYDFAQEITEPEELDGLLNDPDETRMQALMIRERILGPAHPDTSYYIRYRGAVYADGGKFIRCIKLWNYALDIQQSMLGPLEPITQSTFYSFTELFNLLIVRQANTWRRMLPVYRKELLGVFKKAVLEVKLGKQIVEKTQFRDLNKILVTTLHLASLLTHEMPEKDTQEYDELHKTLYEFVKIDAKGNNDRDVLQLAVSEKVGPKSQSTCNVPSANLINALIRAGADVNARDDSGNTVLHLAVMFNWSPNLISILLDAGAHIDTVNKSGSTMETLLLDKATYDSVYPMRYTTLTCLAARIVKKLYNIEDVPKHLQSFVQLH